MPFFPPTLSFSVTSRNNGLGRVPVSGERGTCSKMEIGRPLLQEPPRYCGTVIIKNVIQRDREIERERERETRTMAMPSEYSGILIFASDGLNKHQNLMDGFYVILAILRF